MKRNLGLLMIISFCCCTYNKMEFNDYPSGEYLEITENFSLQEFENVKAFILENGDRESHCNMYNNNPHFTFNGFEVYLNPEIGQKNINCDPEISDFNEIVIRDQNAEPQYYYLLIVRIGDIKNKAIFPTIPQWIKEKNVYLLNPYENDINQMKKNLDGYIEIIETEINRY